MSTLLIRILAGVAISAAIYLLVALALTLTGVPGAAPDTAAQPNISFEELKYDYDGLPELQPYAAGETTLWYRHYPAASAGTVVVLLHGSGWHSAYLMRLAQHLSSQDLAHVYTPDLRGHGPQPERRGDIDYIDQLEDDLADLLVMIRETHPEARLVIGGHSSGGGLALRFGGSQYGQLADAYLLLSPFLKYNAPTTRQNSGGWATPYTGRIIGLSLLNNVGIRRFNHLEAIRFNMPAEVRNGTETLAYSYRLNTGYAPHNYKKDLAAIRQPLLVLVGSADESFIPQAYAPTVAQYNPAARVEVVPGLTHQGIVVDEAGYKFIDEWLQGLE